MESVSREHVWSSECTFQARKCNQLRQKHAMFIPFQVDPSWYEKYWWREPAPDRTAYRRRRFVRRFCRAYMPNRERLLRAADAMKVAKNPFAKILSALRLRHQHLPVPDSGWKSARSEKIGRIVTYPTNR